MALNQRQQRFIDEYVVSLNATKAAIAAGYGAETAAAQGHRLRSNPKVAQAIEDRLRARAVVAAMRQEEVERGLAIIARVDPGDMLAADGTMLPLQAGVTGPDGKPVRMPESVRLAIAGVEVEELWEGRGEERRQVGLVRKVKFNDRLRALELAGRHVGMWPQKLELRADESLADLVLAAQRRREHKVTEPEAGEE